MPPTSQIASIIAFAAPRGLNGHKKRETREFTGFRSYLAGFRRSRTHFSHYQPRIAPVLTLTILVTQSRARQCNCDFESPAERPNTSAVWLCSYP
jgi:hypothetical protein